MTRMGGVGRFSVVSSGAINGGLDVAVKLTLPFVAIRRRSIASI
jgi:hypothetical protein